MIDQLRQIAIFSKVVDHGSFRSAAKELRLSPSVVSHHVSQLEEHLGVALMYRSTRSLRLTREGERLLRATHDMLAAVEAELLDLSVGAGEPSGELSVTAPSVLSDSALPEAIATFHRAYPRVRLEVDFSDTRRDLISDHHDIAIRMGVSGKNTATSRILQWMTRKMVAAPEYLKGRDPVRHPREVEGWDWLSLTPVQNVPVSFEHEEEGKLTIRPKPKLATNDAQALYRLSRAGGGLAIVPDFLADADVADGVIVNLLPDWRPTSVCVFAEWPANAPKSGLVRLMLDHLSAHLKQS